MRVVWLPLALAATAIAVTYARIAPERLYHVHGSGLAAGLGRTLVFLNFPCAFVALGVLAVAANSTGRHGRVAAIVGAALCAVAAWPGVVDADDLDAKWVNAVPAAGVAVAVALSFATRQPFRLPSSV